MHFIEISLKTNRFIHHIISDFYKSYIVKVTKIVIFIGKILKKFKKVLC